MMESITPEAEIKMSPVIDHFNNGFLNNAMRPFYSVGLVFLVWSTKDNINMFSKAKVLVFFVLNSLSARIRVSFWPAF